MKYRLGIVLFLFSSLCFSQSVDYSGLKLQRVELGLTTGPAFYSNSAGYFLRLENNYILDPLSWSGPVQPQAGLFFGAQSSDSDLHSEVALYGGGQLGFLIPIMTFPDRGKLASTAHAILQSDSPLSLDLEFLCYFGAGLVQHQLNDGGQLDLSALSITPTINAVLDFESLRLRGGVGYQMEWIEGTQRSSIMVPLSIALRL